LETKAYDYMIKGFKRIEMENKIRKFGMQKGGEKVQK
jgi:hypothetical protein